MSKTRYDLVPPEVLKGLADAFEDGAKKYKPHDWETGACNGGGAGSVMSTYAALMRHLQSWISRDEVAEDTRLSHLDHALARLAMLKTWEKRNLLEKVDDRITRELDIKRELNIIDLRTLEYCEVCERACGHPIVKDENGNYYTKEKR